MFTSPGRLIEFSFLIQLSWAPSCPSPSCPSPSCPSLSCPSVSGSHPFLLSFLHSPSPFFPLFLPPVLLPLLCPLPFYPPLFCGLSVVPSPFRHGLVPTILFLHVVCPAFPCYCLPPPLVFFVLSLLMRFYHVSRSSFSLFIIFLTFYCFLAPHITLFLLTLLVFPPPFLLSLP